MEEFNFNAPINATVIFDDSDDETKPCIDHLQIKEVESNNNILNNINDFVPQEICHNLSYETHSIEKEKRNNLSKAEFEIIKASQNDLGTTNNNKTTTETLQNQTKKPRDMPCLDDVNGNLQSMIESLKKYDTDCQSKAVNQRNDKRKKSTDGNKPPKRRLTKEFNPNVDPKRLEVQDSTEINQHCNPATTNTETVFPNSLQPNNKTSEQFTVPVEMNQQQLSADTSFSQSLNETNKTVANYLKELLYAVSEHMISIINEYFSYLRLYRSNIGLSLIENAYNDFICTKEHFFNLSYSTVVNVILPRENDTTFTKNFILHTIKVANSKSCTYTYHGHIQPLYVEMIGWVKKRREHIQSMNLNKTTYPVLVEQLQTAAPQHQPPPYPNQYSKQSYKSSTEIYSNPNYSSRPSIISTETGRNPIYSSRPLPAGDLNVDPTHLNKQNQQKQVCYPVVVPPQNSQQSNYENLLYNTQPSQNTAYNQIRNLLLQPNSSDIHNSPPWQKQSTPYWQFPTTQHGQKQASHSWQKDARTTQHISQNSQELNVSLNNQNLPPENSAQFEINIQQPCQKQAGHLCQKYALTTQHISQNRQEQHVSPNNQNLAHENSAQMEPNRSSISRDSGFISPLNFNSSCDQTCKSQEDQRSQTLMTPLITHVTSLNPNASYISNGFCSVCGKTTKKKCLGCYKCYYCSQDCQYQDWQKHMEICK